MMWFTSHSKKSIFCLITVLCLTMGFTVGCKDKAPAEKPTVIQKRIKQAPLTSPAKEQVVAPVAKKPATPVKKQPAGVAESAAAPEKVAASAVKKTSAAKVQAEKTPKQASVQPTPTAKKKPEATLPAEESEVTSLKSSLPSAIPRYNPIGRTDPFAPLFSEKGEGGSNNTKPKRPLTPLEKIDISQLQLVAVIQAPSGNLAMVQDATGKGYILVPGTLIGLNSGRVTKILKDRVVIEEKSKDYLGNVHTNTRELKLQKPLGEE